jgi:hypothetical protein
VDPNQQTRTSTGTFLSHSEDKDGVLSWVEEKIARFTLIPVHHGEVGGSRGGVGPGNAVVAADQQQAQAMAHGSMHWLLVVVGSMDVSPTQYHTGDQSSWDSCRVGHPCDGNTPGCTHLHALHWCALLCC